MKILVACEYSGIVRDAFRSMGHDVISCDLLPTDKEGPHIVGDVRDIPNLEQFDLMIAHPPCTYICSSGLHWCTRQTKCPQHGVTSCKLCGIYYTPEAIARQAKTDDALNFIKFLWNVPIKRICIENPVGCINTRLPFMPRPQYVQPYEYGHDASKKTGLWLKNLPMLGHYEEDYVAPRIIFNNGRSYNRWANQTDSGQNASPESSHRGHDRAKTFEGIAWAMVEAWST